MLNMAPIAYEEFIAYLEKIFKITLSDIKVLIREFHSEMQKGLSGYESSLKMIPSFVDRPKGTEKGKFIALDLGGTNLRILVVELDGKGNSAVLSVSKFVVKKKITQSNAIDFFGFIADCIDGFLTENHIARDKVYDLAFTFSFPVEQTNIAAGKLIVWTKDFTVKGVEGEDVIVLLNEALKRKRVKCIKVAALANDTVGTLVAKSYNDKACDVGIILGTGTNACYPEKIANIQKWRGLNPEDYMIINMEWGNFNRLRLTYYDRELDENSTHKGEQCLEKMVSGMYLGEVTRRVICDLIRRGLLFNLTECKIFSRYDSFKTEHMSMIAEDTSSDLGLIEDFLTDAGLINITLHDKLVLKKVCQLVSTRAAMIAAGAIAAVVTWIDPELKNAHTIAIDGSLYEKYPEFSKIMREVFIDLFKNNAGKIKLDLAKDGSGKGTAIIAAVAAGSI